LNAKEDAVKKRTVTICTLMLMFGTMLLAEGAKVPITTSSEKARKLFLEGRHLAETLQVQESRQYLQRAVQEDPEFAMAYLFLSFAEPSAKGFFETLDRAVARVDKASEGERLWILGVQAGVNAFPMEQRAYYKKLVAAFPEDERAHNLLGTNFFGQQEYTEAIAEYRKATEIAPEFSQPYNQLGYAYRFLGQYGEAEKAFNKYIQLIPGDPNPYDSYAELLMKMGRYDESIESYGKALEINPNFVASHIGIATNLNFKGDHAGARKQLEKLYSIARNDGERRAALFATTVSYIDEGNMEMAIEQQQKQFALAEKIDDAAAMAGDLVTMGNILLESGKPDEALVKFKKAFEIVDASKLSEEVKENNRRNFLFNAARAAIGKGDLKTAKAKSLEYHRQVEAINNAFLIRLSLQLQGMIALEEKNYDSALEGFRQANQQDPYNFYRMALAYQGKGDLKSAKEVCRTVVGFNSLNNIQQSFARGKALKMLELI